MRILLSNDDGYKARGLQVLREALAEVAQVDVIAPEHNNSAKSNALTLNAPLYVHTASDGVRFVNGTPADCVHIALTGLLTYRPDWVISGINLGANMGDDTLYSGTVGAAMEGYLFGIPSLAFSLVGHTWAHIEDAALKARDVLLHLQRTAPESGMAPCLLNVNIPALPFADIKPLQVCHLGRRHSAQSAITQVNPRGQTMYWIGKAGEPKEAGQGTDFHALAQGHVAVTPLAVDLTAHAQLPAWRERLAGLV